MNKKKVILLTGLAVVLLAIIAVVAVVMGNKDDVNQGNKGTQISPTATQTSGTSPTSAPSTGSTSNETTPTTSPATSKAPSTEKPSLHDGEVQIDPALSTDSFTNADLKTAIEFVSDYASASQKNIYFVSGQWSDGDKQPDLNLLKGVMAPYYDGSILNKIDSFKKSKPDTFAKDVLPYMFFFGDNGIVKPNKEICKDDSNTLCPTYFNVSNIDYKEKKGKGGNPILGVTFSTKSVIPLVMNEGNKEAFSIVKYNYNLNLTSSLDEKGKMTFKISDLNNKMSMSKVHIGVPPTDAKGLKTYENRK